MYKMATARVLTATVWLAMSVYAQSPASQGAAAPAAATAAIQGDWRKIGNTLIDRALAGLATGPVDRVWYSADGSQLFLRTSSGKVFATADFETWQATSALPSSPVSRPGAATLPETGAPVRTGRANSPRLYSFAKFVYKSDNNGASWDNLTAYRNTSIIGNDLRDLAVSPLNEEEATAATAAGVFRTVDGGKSWSGLNQGLPNLPTARFLGLPAGDQGTRLALRDSSAVEWQPGQKQAWLPADNSEYLKQIGLRQAISALNRIKVTALEISGETVYLGTADAQIQISANGGRNLFPAYRAPQSAPVERFWIDSADARIAIAVLGSSSSPAPVHVLRTINGGTVWDDMTGDLGDLAVHGVTADRASGAVYIATDRGVFYASADLETIGSPVSWSRLTGLPDAPAADVKLDEGGNQLWAAIDGFGVYSTLAPHRLRDPRVVSAADFVARAAAPGSLVSVAGARVSSAQAGSFSASVLASTDTESQIQIPFEARGSTISLAVSSEGRTVTLPSVPLEPVAPAIFVARDGSPMLLDAESGLTLDAMNPAHSRGHIQILSTGLGRVTPDWPNGIAAPVDNPPRVAATVRAYLDRQPVEVTRAVLAPYIGYYLIEIEVPKIVNYGPAELYLEVGGQASNRVRVYIEP
jgi:uncharacterized protein (TIGR03437 family)